MRSMIITRFIKFYFALVFTIVLFSFNHPQKIILPVPINKTGVISASSIENEIFVYVNRHRKLLGLKLLQLSNIESSAASEHSGNMASGKISFGHQGFSERIKVIEGHLGGTNASAENVAYGHLNAKQVVDVWLQSAQHRKNMEGDFTFTGIGVAKGKSGTMYYTEIFTN
jgi:uncharacterized protein YkwD